MQTCSLELFWSDILLLISIETARQTRSNVYDYIHRQNSARKETQERQTILPRSLLLLRLQCQILFSSGRDRTCVWHLDINKTFLLTLKEELHLCNDPEPKDECSKDRLISIDFYFFIDLHSNLKKRKRKEDYFTDQRRQQKTRTYLYVYV